MFHQPAHIIPPQQTGKFSDIVETIRASTQIQARLNFEEARKRLLHVNSWQQFSQGISASFTLTDAAGYPKTGLPAPGDYVRIDIPGPGTVAGKGYDWVQVELVEDRPALDVDQEYTAMRVRPSAAPGSTGETAHFFEKAATSSFIVKREDTLVTAGIHGRNEQINTSTGHVTDTIRNGLVGLGAKVGLSGIQWQKLAKGLLQLS